MMLLALFYIFRDQEARLRGLRSVSPFSEQETESLFTRVADTVYASLYGSVAMKLLQGFLGGLMFWILGLPASLLWGAVMALLAVVPVVGTAAVWVPGALFLAWQGHWIKALVLVGWGAAVISTIDNVLYPIVVGKELRLPTLGIFVAVIGGLAAFGAAGVVLGPMILAATLALAEVWRQRAGPVLAEDQITTDTDSLSLTYEQE